MFARCSRVPRVSAWSAPGSAIASTIKARGASSRPTASFTREPPPVSRLPTRPYQSLYLSSAHHLLCGHRGYARHGGLGGRAAPPPHPPPRLCLPSPPLLLGGPRGYPRHGGLGGRVAQHPTPARGAPPAGHAAAHH